MSCGSERNEWQHPEELHKIDSSPENNETGDDVYFEYTGATALTVTGNMSGKKYRFLFMGDRQLIDYWDAEGMMAVPLLKMLKAEKA